MFKRFVVWLMAKMEGGMWIFVGSQKGFGTVCTGTGLGHYEFPFLSLCLFPISEKGNNNNNNIFFYKKRQFIESER